MRRALSDPRVVAPVAAVLVAALVAAALILHKRTHTDGSVPASGMSGSIQPPVRDAAASIRTTTIAGIPTTTAEPRHPNGRAVLFLHGTDETAAADLRTPMTAVLIAALLRSGYSWTEPQTDAENWGNRARVAEDLSVAGALQASGSRIVLMAASMGGLDALQILPKVDPVAFVGIYPVCNLASIAGNPTFAPAVAASQTDVSALSPVPIRGPAGLSVLVLASPQDTTVPAAENADVCARDMRAARMSVTQRATVGPHGDPSNWRPGPIVGFLNRQLGR